MRTKNLDFIQFKKAARNMNIPFKTAYKWKQLVKDEPNYFLNKLQSEID